MALGAARRLPNAERVLVEQRRVREYLLNREHESGGSKARFFIAHGFGSGAWELWRTSLIIHAGENTVTRTTQTRWGIRYTIECNCPSPDGRNPCIRTVWQMEGDMPRILTAIPL